MLWPVTKYANVSQDLECYLVRVIQSMEKESWRGNADVEQSVNYSVHIGMVLSYHTRTSNVLVSLTMGTNVLRIQNPALLKKETHIHIFLLSS